MQLGEHHPFYTVIDYSWRNRLGKKKLYNSLEINCNIAYRLILSSNHVYMSQAMFSNHIYENYNKNKFEDSEDSEDSEKLWFKWPWSHFYINFTSNILQ